MSGDVEADPPESEGNRGGRSGHPVAVSPDGNDQGGAGAALSRVVRPRGEGPSEEAHGLTIEQGETLQKMVLRTVFMQGWFGEEKETELRSMGLLIGTKVGRMDNCAKLSRTGSEIAQKLMIAEIDDMAASD